MKREEDQELWDLLGRSSRPKLSPFFSRNVLRQVRQETPAPGRAWSWLTPKLLIPMSAVAVAVVAAVLLFRSSPPAVDVAQEKPLAPATPAQSVSVPEPEPKLDSSAPDQITAQGEAEQAPAQGEAQEIAVQDDQGSDDEPSLLASIDDSDYDVVENLDDLLVLYESNLWDENSSL